MQRRGWWRCPWGRNFPLSRTNGKKSFKGFMKMAHGISAMGVMEKGSWQGREKAPMSHCFVVKVSYSSVNLVEGWPGISYGKAHEIYVYSPTTCRSMITLCSSLLAKIHQFPSLFEGRRRSGGAGSTTGPTRRSRSLLDAFLGCFLRLFCVDDGPTTGCFAVETAWVNSISGTPVLCQEERRTGPG